MSKEKQMDHGEMPLMQPVAYAKDAEAGHVEVRQSQGGTDDFVGLTKEQLERYADDPFWRNLRWILFILFWLAWIAMFVAAIIIVVLSPKCPEKQVRHWWQKKVGYQVYTNSFKDSDGDGVGDFKGIEESLGELKRIRVQTIWPYPVVQSQDSSGYATEHFEAVDADLGTTEDFISLVDSAHSKDMHVVMDFVPSVTSNQHEWFAATTQADPVGEDKYHWKSSIAGLPENRWSAGSDKREGQYYLHWPGIPERPILNLKNSDVMNSVLSTLKVWLERNVDGFYIFSRFLAVNDNGETDYDGVHDVFKTIRNAVDDYKNETESDREILLFTSLDPTEAGGAGQVEDLKVSLVTEGMLNFVINSELASKEPLTGGEIHDELTTQFARHRENNETWPMWEVGNPMVSRVATRYGSVATGELMTMLLMTLPGSINTYYGDEIGMTDISPDGITLANADNFVMRSPMQWDDSENAGFSAADPSTLKIPIHHNYTTINYEAANSKSTSSLRLYKRLAGIRQRDETFLFGTVELGNRTDDVLLMVRRPETIGINYVVLLNFGSAETTVDLTQPPVAAPESCNVVEMTSNLDDRGEFGIREDIDVTSLTLRGAEGIVVKFKTV